LLRIDNSFEAIYFAAFIVGSVIRKVYTRGRRKNKITDDWKSLLDTVLLSFASCGLFIPLIYLLTPWLDFADYQLPAWIGWIGTAIFVIALWLLWRSHVALGRNWSVKPQIRQEHSLVTEGAFKYIRHPMYAAHWLWAIAQLLLLHNLLAGPVFIVTFLPLYITRVPREEQMLLKHFGQQYRNYMTRTGRLIPRLWT
jgi:protein-S-isoprenylcysteine O-methyltransferase Ste14